MSEPTAYDLAQDERITDVEGTLQSAYLPTDGVEYSYPVVGQGMDDEMWQYVTLANGNGVLDTGGSPYNLVLNGNESNTNSTNSMKLTVSTVSGTAQAVLRGFYHRLLEDMVIPLPGVTSNTTYYIVLEYDPAKGKSANGPISVQVLTSLDYTGGKHYLVLWKVQRKPNQLLTDASIEKFTPRVIPTQLVFTEEQLPDPSKCIWGSLYFVHETSEIVMAVGANQSAGGPTRWKNLTSPEWIESTSGAFPASPSGFKPARRIVGDRVEFRGRCSRSDGSKFVSGSTYTLVPNTLDAKGTLIMNAGSDSTRNPIAMEVETGGKPVFRPKADTPYIDLTGFFYYWK